MILLIDNYDSFTYNLAHLLGGVGAEVVVRRNDEVTVSQAEAMDPDAVVLSPGPGRPESAGVCIDLVKKLNPAIPVLGVCLGHQAIAAAHGATIGEAKTIMHGKTSRIATDGTGLFDGLPPAFDATRYHSLVLIDDALPEALRVTARADDGEIMALAHETRPLYGVQFHPESIATEQGRRMASNFLKMARSRGVAA